MHWSVEHALEYWERNGQLTKAKATELKHSLAHAAADDAGVPVKAITVFSVIGAVLIGLGVMLFVASNWSAIPAPVKVLLLLAATVGTALAGYHFAYERKTYPISGLAVLFVNVFIFGASIFLIGQIFHLPLNFWWGMLLWFLGTVFMAYVLESRMHLWLSVPLFLCFLAWFRTVTPFGFLGEIFGPLFDRSTSILTVFPIVGLGLVGLAVLHRRWKSLHFGRDTLMHWGVFLIVGVAVMVTVDRSALFMFLSVSLRDPFTVVIIAASALSVVAALAFGVFTSVQGRMGLLALTAYVLEMFAVIKFAQLQGAGADTFAYMYESSMPGYLLFLHTLLVFMCLLAVVWFGTILRMTTLVNMGTAFLGIAIAIQYFSWAFTLFDRSFAFILGGILLIFLSIALERKRRDLLSSIGS